MNDQTHIVYVRADGAGRITTVLSGEFLADASGWTAIDEGEGPRFFHAQALYFNKPLKTPEGAWRYALKDGRAVERAQDALDAEAAASAPPCDAERIAALEEENAMLTACLLEMSEIIYA